LAIGDKSVESHYFSTKNETVLRKKKMATPCESDAKVFLLGKDPIAVFCDGQFYSYRVTITNYYEVGGSLETFLSFEMEEEAKFLWGTETIYIDLPHNPKTSIGDVRGERVEMANITAVQSKAKIINSKPYSKAVVLINLWIDEKRILKKFERVEFWEKHPYFYFSGIIFARWMLRMIGESELNLPDQDVEVTFVNDVPLLVVGENSRGYSKFSESNGFQLTDKIILSGSDLMEIKQTFDLNEFPECKRFFDDKNALRVETQDRNALFAWIDNDRIHFPLFQKKQGKVKFSESFFFDDYEMADDHSLGLWFDDSEEEYQFPSDNKRFPEFLWHIPEICESKEPNSSCVAREVPIIRVGSEIRFFVDGGFDFRNNLDERGFYRKEHLDETISLIPPSFLNALNCVTPPYWLSDEGRMFSSNFDRHERVTHCELHEILVVSDFTRGSMIEALVPFVEVDALADLILRFLCDNTIDEVRQKKSLTFRILPWIREFTKKSENQILEIIESL
jgi:hypothetical protein